MQLTSIQTKFQEKVIETKKPSEMLNKYLAKSIVKKWTEYFCDADTGETVSIERNEILFRRGELIDQDKLAKIRFSMDADGIESVTVSNQKRVAIETVPSHLYLFSAKVRIADKKHKFLLYSNSIETCLSILRGYIELNYTDNFMILNVADFTNCIVIIDNLEKEMPTDLPFDEEIKPEKKFYLIEVRISTEDNPGYVEMFLVHTVSVEKGMILITDAIEKRKLERESKGEDLPEYTTSLEAVKPVPIGSFIPKELSQAYVTE
jgi:hypothetical protein